MAGATGCPRHRRGAPSWCHGFCLRENKLITAQSYTAPRVQKHAPPRLCGNSPIPPNVSCNCKNINYIKTTMDKIKYRIKQSSPWLYIATLLSVIFIGMAIIIILTSHHIIPKGQPLIFNFMFYSNYGFSILFTQIYCNS